MDKEIPDKYCIHCGTKLVTKLTTSFVWEYNMNTGKPVENDLIEYRCPNKKQWIGWQHTCRKFYLNRPDTEWDYERV